VEVVVVLVTPIVMGAADKEVLQAFAEQSSDYLFFGDCCG
jgi:hypothetical protein